jgi:hypothetical protein
VASFATYFNHQNYCGREITVDEFRDALRQYSRDPLIYLCAAISAMLKCWQGGVPAREPHAYIVRSLFEPHDAEELIRGSLASQDPHFVFHRQQLLFVAKEAILHCPADGLDPLLQPRGPVGTLFLMANDQLHYGFPTTEDYEQKLLNMLTEFVIVAECSGYHAFRNSIARAHLMYSRLSDELTHDPDYVDIRGKFERIVDMPIEEFQALCFSLLSKYFRIDVHSYAQEPNTFLLQRSYFEKTAIPVDKVDRFVQEMSEDPENLKKIYERRLKGKNDFTLFRSKPLCFVRDRVFCIDVGLLSEKLESGPFWRVQFSLDDAGRESLHRFWGKLFEHYVNWMLGDCIGKNNRHNVLYANPKYEDGSEVCDAIILCGSAAIFVEYKGATFTAAAKYSGSPSVLKTEIESKLLQNDRGRPKGIMQLADAIRRTCRREAPEGIHGIDLSDVRTIYPLLLTRDAIGDVFLINEILNAKFRAIPTLSRKTVQPKRLTPLVCMAAETIEQVAPYLSDVPFSDIIDDRYRGRRSMGANFFGVDIPLLRELGERENKILAGAFHEFTQPLVKALFPEEYARANAEHGVEVAGGADS